MGVYVSCYKCIPANRKYTSEKMYENYITLKYTIVVEHVALAFPTLPLNLNRGQKQFGLKNWKCKFAYTAKAAHNVLT